LNTVWDLGDWFSASILRKRGGYNQAANEHMVCSEFITVGKAEKAAAAMERHLISTESRFLKRLENNKWKN
jgi:DNA-binding FadR family transcriptional regulator